MSQRPRDWGYRKSGVLSSPRNHVLGRLEDGDDELVRGVQALAPHEGGGVDLRKKSCTVSTIHNNSVGSRVYMQLEYTLRSSAVSSSELVASC